MKNVNHQMSFVPISMFIVRSSDTASLQNQGACKSREDDLELFHLNRSVIYIRSRNLLASFRTLTAVKNGRSIQLTLCAEF